MSEDRDLDKKTIIVPPNKSNGGVNKDVIKSAYLTETVSFEDLAKRFHIPALQIEQMALSENWDQLRNEYIANGINRIQHIQVKQVHKLIDIESKFKTLKIIQLEDRLKDFLAYYERFGDLKKRHPLTGEILVDQNGLPHYISIPNVTKDLADLKESVNISEGTKALLDRLEKIVNSAQLVKKDHNTIDISDYNDLFESQEN